MGAALVSLVLVFAIAALRPHSFLVRLFDPVMGRLMFDEAIGRSLMLVLAFSSAIVAGYRPYQVSGASNHATLGLVIRRGIVVCILVICLFAPLREVASYVITGNVFELIDCSHCSDVPGSTSILSDLSLLAGITLLSLPLLCLCLVPGLLPLFVIAAYAEIEFAHRRKERELDQIR